MSFNLDNYVDVAERVQRFYEKYPEGSLRCKEWRTIEANGQTFFVYVAQAFRTADDGNPAEGIAWEPVPGKTPYTESSEAMVCETSAWGRAIAALGFEVKRGIASRQEVMNRRSADGGGSNTLNKRTSPTEPQESTAAVSTPEPPSSAQKGKITQLLNKNVALAHHADLKAQATSKRDATELISRLIKVDAGERDVHALLKSYGITPASDVPVDTEGLDPNAP